MSKEYICKQDAVDLVNKISNLDPKAKGGICVSLANLEKADVVPVVHGKWMKEDRGRVEYCAVCDQCGFDWMWSDGGYFKFCPNCGAKMDAR